MKYEHSNFVTICTVFCASLQGGGMVAGKRQCCVTMSRSHPPSGQSTSHWFLAPFWVDHNLIAPTRNRMSKKWLDLAQIPYKNRLDTQNLNFLQLIFASPSFLEEVTENFWYPNISAVAQWGCFDMHVIMITARNPSHYKWLHFRSDF